MKYKIIGASSLVVSSEHETYNAFIPVSDIGVSIEKPVAIICYISCTYLVLIACKSLSCYSLKALCSVDSII